MPISRGCEACDFFRLFQRNFNFFSSFKHGLRVQNLGIAESKSENMSYPTKMHTFQKWPCQPCGSDPHLVRMHSFRIDKNYCIFNPLPLPRLHPSDHPSSSCGPNAGMPFFYTKFNKKTSRIWRNYCNSWKTLDIENPLFFKTVQDRSKSNSQKIYGKTRVLLQTVECLACLTFHAVPGI